MNNKREAAAKVKAKEIVAGVALAATVAVGCLGVAALTNEAQAATPPTPTPRSSSRVVTDHICAPGWPDQKQCPPVRKVEFDVPNGVNKSTVGLKVLQEEGGLVQYQKNQGLSRDSVVVVTSPDGKTTPYKFIISESENGEKTVKFVPIVESTPAGTTDENTDPPPLCSLADDENQPDSQDCGFASIPVAPGDRISVLIIHQDHNKGADAISSPGSIRAEVQVDFYDQDTETPVATITATATPQDTSTSTPPPREATYTPTVIATEDTPTPPPDEATHTPTATATHTPTATGTPAATTTATPEATATVKPTEQAQYENVSFDLITRDKCPNYSFEVKFTSKKIENPAPGKPDQIKVLTSVRAIITFPKGIPDNLGLLPPGSRIVDYPGKSGERITAIVIPLQDMILGQVYPISLDHILPKGFSDPVNVTVISEQGKPIDRNGDGEYDDYDNGRVNWHDDTTQLDPKSKCPTILLPTAGGDLASDLNFANQPRPDKRRLVYSSGGGDSKPVQTR